MSIQLRLATASVLADDARAQSAASPGSAPERGPRPRTR